MSAMTYDELVTAQKVFNELQARGYLSEEARDEVAASLGMIEMGHWDGLEIQPAVSAACGDELIGERANADLLTHRAFV
jgi:hypothetical protein